MAEQPRHLAYSPSGTCTALFSTADWVMPFLGFLYQTKGVSLMMRGLKAPEDLAAVGFHGLRDSAFRRFRDELDQGACDDDPVSHPAHLGSLGGVGYAKPDHQRGAKAFFQF